MRGSSARRRSLEAHPKVLPRGVRLQNLLGRLHSRRGRQTARGSDGYWIAAWRGVYSLASRANKRTSS